MRVIAETIEPGVEGAIMVVDRAGVAVRVGTGVGVENVTGSGVVVASVAVPEGAPHATVIPASTSAAAASAFMPLVYCKRKFLAKGFGASRRASQKLVFDVIANGAKQSPDWNREIASSQTCPGGRCQGRSFLATRAPHCALCSAGVTFCGLALSTDF